VVLPPEVAKLLTKNRLLSEVSSSPRIFRVFFFFVIEITIKKIKIKTKTNVIILLFVA
jgi:hypothetical protein